MFLLSSTLCIFVLQLLSILRYKTKTRSIDFTTQSKYISSWATLVAVILFYLFLFSLLALCLLSNFFHLCQPRYSPYTFILCKWTCLAISINFFHTSDYSVISPLILACISREGVLSSSFQTIIILLLFPFFGFLFYYLILLDFTFYFFHYILLGLEMYSVLIYLRLQKTKSFLCFW